MREAMRPFVQRYRYLLLLFSVIFFLLIAISGLLVISKKTPVIRSDGKGYYLYLPGVFIHHDLSMKWTEPLQQLDPGWDEWYGLTEYREGVYLNKYPIGQAVLWLPFFLVAHVLSFITGLPADGFSAWYQLSVVFAAAVYGALGCVVLYMVLRRSFSVKVSLGTTLALLLGTNALHYATADATFTHIYSFFLVACLLYLIPKWYNNMRLRTSVLLAALIGLIILVRQTDALLIIVALLWNVGSVSQLKARFVLLWQRWQTVAIMAGVGLAVLLPQLLYYKYITGSWLVFSYGKEGFNFLKPEILNVLFSSDRGVFFWAPILLFALVGLPLLWRQRRLREWAVPVCVFFAIWLYVISSWHSWQFGMSYGHRAFIDALPLLGLSMAAFFAWVGKKGWLMRRTVFALSLLLVGANIFMTYHYWVGNVAGSGTTIAEYMKLWRFGLVTAVDAGLSYGLIALVGLIFMAITPLVYYFLIKPPDKLARS